MKRFLYKIKDNYSDTRAKYKECLTFIVWEDIPQKYINTKIPYRHSYYFTEKEDRDNFLDELFKAHKEKEKITQEYLSEHKQKEQQKLFYYAVRDLYDESEIFEILVFEKSLTQEERDDITDKIYELKEQIEDYQTDEIITELHKFYNFEEIFLENQTLYI